MNYLAILEEGPSSYGAYVPDLPGCAVVAETRKEALKLIREAISLHIESLREDGDAVPEQFQARSLYRCKRVIL